MEDEKLKVKLADYILKVDNLEKENRALKWQVDYYRNNYDILKEEKDKLTNDLSVYNKYEEESKKISNKCLKDTLRYIQEVIVDIQRLAISNSDIIETSIKREVTIDSCRENISILEGLIESIREEVVDKEVIIEHLEGSIERHQEEIERLNNENTELVFENSFTELYNRGKTVKDLIIEEKRKKYTTYNKDLIEKIKEIYKFNSRLSYKEVADKLETEGVVKYISKTSVRKIVIENNIIKDKSPRGRRKVENNP